MWREATIWAVAGAWLAAVAGGFCFWERYDRTPGAVSAARTAEPQNERWRLTVFAHPHCPCTRAALRELADLNRGPELSVRVAFVRPAGAGDGWERGESWDAAARQPGAEVSVDADGAEARRFGAETSGFAVLTDRDGRAVFRGGLTRARGGRGDSAGRRAVAAWLDTGNGAPSAPVFGCPLFTPDD